MAKVFVFPEGHKLAGKSVQLMNRYTFVDGVHLEEDDDSAKAKEPNLCGFYGCKMLDHEAYVKSKTAKPAAAPAAAAAHPAQAASAPTKA